MEYSQFLFSQLFMTVNASQVTDLNYDQIYPVLNKVWLHWLATDELYGQYADVSEYVAMVEYLREHAGAIASML